ncbi:hypothetical protein TWF281_001927 [Arthrobotrys megalospora]
MDTPRLPASFPKTPTSIRTRGPERHADQPPRSLPRTKPNALETPVRVSQEISTQDASTGPYVPISVIDAPTQRLYACSIFILIQAYKFYEIGRLYSTDDDSVSELWLILKWVAVDGVFLRLLPLLRIPWLTFSTYATVVQIVLVSMIDIFFCLRYQDALIIFALSLWKHFFGHELSLSERRIKIRNVLDKSPILGKHTVHYLPEGSAMLNPSNFNLCYSSLKKEGTSLPIMVNSSIPALIQLSVRNFETLEPETINITQKEIKKLLKSTPAKPSDPKIHHIHYPIKYPGLYRLEKVIDVTQLVVRVRKAELLIAACPSASFTGAQPNAISLDRCKGELSDLTLEVVGLPPLQVRYGRSVNQDEKDVTIQSISPVGYKSPLLRSQDGNAAQKSFLDEDLGWARPQKVSIPLNESLASQGAWSYVVEEVVDAVGNVVKYNARGVGPEFRLQRSFKVHERPLVKYLSCSPQNPLMVARGKKGTLPIEIGRDVESAPYEVSYSFSPQVGSQGEGHSEQNVELRTATLKTSGQLVTVSAPGLYTLKSISSRFCVGEVLEPSTCLFLTPPDPSLSISFDEIVDRCAGSSIGLTVDMDLTGSPPFTVYYRTLKDKHDVTVNTIEVKGTRHQLRLTPSAAGHYTYEFYAIDDGVYKDVNLDFKKLSVNQRIIPMAGAKFSPPSANRRCCIGETATFAVDMQGSGPWSLEYELVHSGKRTKFQDSNIPASPHLITTPKLVSGGDYSLVLTTIQDSHGCKVFLKSEAQIDVRRQRPSASFAEIDGSRVANSLESESVSLPLRLVGEKPFRIKYRFTDENGAHSEYDIIAKDFNSHLPATRRGRYQLLTVYDAICPGSVAEAANTFDIDWIPRPFAGVVQSTSITMKDGIYVRNPICQGDEDALELSLEGLPPFVAFFERHWTDEKGESRPIEPIDLKAGTTRASIRMKTSEPGKYKYVLSRISDRSYVQPAPPSSPLSMEQIVHARPSARFRMPGKVHKYCLETGTGDDTIPVVLEGIAPFFLSIGVRHYSTGKEEVINIPNIDSTNYIFRVPRHALTLGGHVVRIKKIRDSRGCSQDYKADLPSVSVSVAEPPSITSLDSKPYYCVGDRISYSLAGSPPFTLEYTFSGKKEKISTSSIFQRIAERPGTLIFDRIKDSASDCQVDVNITKVVHDIPSVRVSEGSQVTEGIHEGEHVEIHFQLDGSPPFTFTYIRSEIPKKGAKPKILEMHTQTTEEYRHTIVASLEGTYEVVSIHDRYCGYTSPKSHEFTTKQSDYKV